MKKVVPVLTVLVLVASMYSLYITMNTNELVYVDINKLLEGYDRTEIIKAKYEEKARLLQSNVDSLITDWQKELREYEKNRANYSKKESSLKQELLGNKQKQISSYQNSINRKIQEEDKKATQTVINDINDFVKEYGKENRYKIIFGANGVGNIMYADKGTNLTDKILEGLNKEFQGKK